MNEHQACTCPASKSESFQIVTDHAVDKEKLPCDKRSEDKHNRTSPCLSLQVYPQS